MYPHHASRVACVGVAWPCACKCTASVSLSVELRWWKVHCLTPNVAALALQGLMVLLAHTLASFPAIGRQQCVKLWCIIDADC